MKMIVGLGNIGPQYDRTRHNVGFMVIDHVAEEYGVTFKRAKQEALIGSTLISGEKVLLVKPTTYMNDSGRAVRPLMDYYDIPLEDVMIVHDDMDLPIGKIRLRQKGSAGGHNGIKSIIAYVGTQAFKRVRVGIDHPTRMSVVDYVLGHFTATQTIGIRSGMDEAQAAIEKWVEGTKFDEVMNEFN
ncbi:MAG: aminoacyl-tRNA hydrolase [Furfurilactobacillus sp.]|jgi:PTH1 family peptidyl-tRNA hydrolase|uniref:Peptidyl-tRNA hydrolase n=1 Tax=Furfurilactobacillus milii TaxID=2888272 RepID=A0ABT6D7G4_9LACO|nr:MULTISPECIES: aminoacyl-tRNA hydrolase [Furfurilactobacillus]QLE65973.1 Peptidyl-tRNA hydrolase [Furfurilactobacillus rossiae]MCF6160122.1 aminoacyl-tRNA hydrolase [Furfurilactobacillus milii]MCF6162065.1 aminoacyl-tRNA hydrolase [Furfurilactobacillus milii]MCF6420296.1 aminoacyl-tRNA hydrolase [Furfurilactobacillus milii]MCH4012493.1 aminoacyl-tRNA hydrolase [Furfurilactobacillus sp.]